MHDIAEYHQCPRPVWCELAAFVSRAKKNCCGLFVGGAKNCWLSFPKVCFDCKNTRKLSNHIVCTKKIIEMQLIFHVFSCLMHGIWRELTIFATAFCKECKTYCSITSQSPPREKEQTLIIGTVPTTGAGFPYIRVVCGEPWGVWRKSAPLLFIYVSLKS